MFDETSPPQSPNKKPENPLMRQIRSNLNPISMIQILTGGPERWMHVITQVATKLRPDLQERDAAQTERQLLTEIKKSGLKPLKFEFEFADTPMTCVGCELPNDANFSLVVPVSLEDKEPELHSYIPPGKYLYLPATTSEEWEGRYFNNGLYQINRDGQVRQITSKIEPFKGSIKLGVGNGDGGGSGQIILLSQDETQTILTKPAITAQNYPDGGILLGTSLYTQLDHENPPSITDAINSAVQNRYFDSYNTEFPCYLSIGTKTYYFNIILRRNPGKKAVETIVNTLNDLTDIAETEREAIRRDDYVYSSRILLGLFGALQTAAKVKEGNLPVKIVMAEQNFYGRLRYEEYNSEEYPTYPLIACKLG